ncbi:SnoaL-like domain-containing protein [Novosphingobium sp. CF614]|uniref:nuclear transport factor 2 family protein n=1 Tax=Novosphingobium sp. CF614 TaxID=1884364 RepID=UPI0008F25466|nr:nuclear transport factor 2 family protein [Novosphingobium sp. CF614]SFG44590.1 SnoaL-like domain-containing protein [Novosphingobium sp. CF614]
MDALERLLTERAVERMIADYAALNDAGDWAAVAAMYVPEGRMSRPTAPDAFVEGRDAILAAFQARPARASRHVVANIRVVLAGDGATATSQILLFTAADKLPLVGTYADRLVLTDEGWRFIERRGSLDFT